MKKLLALVALFAIAAFGYQNSPVQLHNLGAAQAVIEASGQSFGTVVFQITGTWVGTVTFEGTVSGAWVGIPATNLNSTSASTTTTSNGLFAVPCVGLNKVRARMSAYTSGTAAVTGMAVDGIPSAALSSSGSGGAVTQSGVWTVQPGNTENTTPWLMECPTCSGSGVNQGSTTSGQSGSLTMGAVTTAAPTYTTGQTSPFSVDLTGGLRVNPSGYTSPVSLASVPSHAVTNVGTFAVQAAQSGTWNITNLSGTVSLPTGAATAAKQPALGTAGSASTDVITVQGIASGTNIPVTCSNCSGSGVSATDATAFTPGTSVFAPGGGLYQVTQTSNPITTGQQGAFQSTRFRALHVTWRDSTGAVVGDASHPIQVSLANTASNGTPVSVTCGNCSGSGVSATDATSFTPGTSVFVPDGGLYQVTQTSNPLTTGQQGAFQATRFRALHITWRDSTGAVVGDATHPIQVSLANTGANGTGIKVDGSAVTQPVSIATAPALVASSAIIGKVGIDQTTPGTTNLVSAGQSGTWNVTNISGTVSLPTGASTAAKQPALGTAGSASTDVISVQGIASMTPFLSNPGTAANWGTGATGSAAPANAQYAGAVSSGNLTGIIQADNSVKIDVSTATTTQLVALSSTKKIYVTSWDIIAAGTGTIKLVYGTGSNCGTGTTDLTGPYSLVAQSGIAKGGGLGPVIVVPASQALCVTTSAAVGMQGSVAYTQF